MSDTGSLAETKKRRGPPPGRHQTPANPDQVRRIVLLRDVHGLTFHEISRALSANKSITRMGVNLAYRRWRDWAYTEGGRGALN